MKKVLRKIVAYIKKNYIASTIVAAIILVLGASFIIIGLINMNKNRIELSSEEVSLYQYFADDKKEFEAKLSYENDKMVNISSKTYSVYENSPIYVKDAQKIIIPKTSSIVFYYRQNLSYRLPKYSTLHYTEGASFVSSNGKKGAPTGFFIYDGEDTYIIPDESELTINKLKVTLSPYSYVTVTSGYVIIYDYKNDDIKMYEEEIKKAGLTIGDVAIDLLKDVTVLNSKVSIIGSNFSKLNVYMEEENGK